RPWRSVRAGRGGASRLTCLPAATRDLARRERSDAHHGGGPVLNENSVRVETWAIKKAWHGAVGAAPFAQKLSRYRGSVIRGSVPRLHCLALVAVGVPSPTEMKAGCAAPAMGPSLSRGNFNAIQWSTRTRLLAPRLNAITSDPIK